MKQVFSSYRLFFGYFIYIVQCSMNINLMLLLCMRKKQKWKTTRTQQRTRQRNHRRHASNYPNGSLSRRLSNSGPPTKTLGVSRLRLHLTAAAGEKAVSPFSLRWRSSNGGALSGPFCGLFFDFLAAGSGR